MSTYTPWTITHIDVDDGLPAGRQAASPNNARRQAASPKTLAVFWRGDVPLGHAWFDRHQLPLTESELRNLDFASSTPFAEAEETPEKLPSIAVVIPTHRRADALRRCLESVSLLEDGPAEVVVVDNSGGDEDTRRVVTAFPWVRYVLETRPGASIARNTGFACTKSDVVAFVDDDETVHPGWTKALRTALASDDCGLATGLVLPASLQSEAQFLFEKRFSFIRGYRRRVFSPDVVLTDRTFAPWRLGGSGNLAVRREVFERVNGFDTRLGAGRSGCSEDTDFFQRVLESGTACVYDPRAVVFHEHREEYAALKSQAFRYMRGHVIALLVALFERNDPHALRRLAFALPGYYAASFARLAGGDTGLRADLLLTEVLGCLSGLTGYAREAFRRMASRFSAPLSVSTSKRTPSSITA